VAFFIHTDSDEAMLQALEVARDIDTGSQMVASASDPAEAILADFDNKMSALFSAPQLPFSDDLARLDRGIPQVNLAAGLKALEEEVPTDMADRILEENALQPQETMQFGAKDRCGIFNSINGFNRGIDMGGSATVKNLEEVSRQGLSASILLFTALGHPTDTE
jgi:hypothetical protein